jgi:Chaperone of endosialidase
MKTVTDIIHFAFALMAFASLALTPALRAVDPPPDGGYLNANTAEGENALFSLPTRLTPLDNTAIGYNALYSTTSGEENTATGSLALRENTVGSQNTAIGFRSLWFNTTGNRNTAIGEEAFFNNRTGSDNIALGHEAGSRVRTGSQNIYIGNSGVDGESNTIRIGERHTRTFIAGLRQAIAPGSPVIVNANDQLGILTSSARFKEDIKSMDQRSEAILALKPVSFHYTKDIDPQGTAQFGLIAEEVAKANPDLVIRDPDGKPFSVRYEAVNTMLLNEFLKEHQRVQALEKQVEKLTAGLQKVSAELEATKPAPQVVNNP